MGGDWAHRRFPPRDINASIRIGRRGLGYPVCTRLPHNGGFKTGVRIPNQYSCIGGNWRPRRSPRDIQTAFCPPRSRRVSMARLSLIRTSRWMGLNEAGWALPDRPMETDRCRNSPRVGGVSSSDPRSRNRAKSDVATAFFTPRLIGTDQSKLRLPALPVTWWPNCAIRHWGG